MFERLTVPARQAINEAHGVARGGGRSRIEPGDILVGMLHTDGAVAAEILRSCADGGAVEAAARALPEGGSDHDDLLRMTMAASAGVASSRGGRSIGTATLLTALLALEPPSLTRLFDAVGIDPGELAAAARAGDDTGEPMEAATDGEWVLTIGGTDPSVAWSDSTG